MLQIIGFILCALLYAIGEHANITVDTSNAEAVKRARRLSSACLIAAISFIFWLIAQGNLLQSL